MVAHGQQGNRAGGGCFGFLAGLTTVMALPLLVGLGARIERGYGPAEWVEPVRLTILHTNDMHGRVLPSRSQPGLSALGRLIVREREEAREDGRDVLVLDAGDCFQGTPEGNETRGEVVVAWMNHVGYTAQAIGNHEFDFGAAVPEALAGLAEFPVLGANARVEASGERLPWLGKGDAGPLRGAVHLLEVGRATGAPARLALIGLTTSDMKNVTLRGMTDGLVFEDELVELERVFAELPPVDLVVLVTHCGLEVDRRVAERFADRVDLIVGGHSHTELPEGERVGEVLVAQAGDKTRFLGRVRVTLPRTGGPDARPRMRAELLAVSASDQPVGEDPVAEGLRRVLQPYIDRVGPLMNVTVAELQEDLLREPGYASSRLGNLHADLMREATGAELAFHNKTGIRAELLAGPVTPRAVFEVAPFDNTVVHLSLRGQDVLALLEFMLSEPRKLLEVSGVVLTCDPTRPPGSRLLRATVDGAPIDPTRTYTVATNNFLARGGDDHVAFTRGTRPVDTGLLLRDLLQRHLVERSPFVPAPFEARILATAAATARD